MINDDKGVDERLCHLKNQCLNWGVTTWNGIPPLFPKQHRSLTLKKFACSSSTDLFKSMNVHSPIFYNYKTDFNRLGAKDGSLLTRLVKAPSSQPLDVGSLNVDKDTRAIDLSELWTPAQVNRPTIYFIL